MSDSVDDANHAAKAETNGDLGLGGVRDDIEALVDADFVTPANAEQDKKACADLINEAMEDVNAARIKAADDKIRSIRQILDQRLAAAAASKRKQIFKKLDSAARSKRKITQPAIGP